MATGAKLKDEFNPLIPGTDDARMLAMFIEAARTGVMETFTLMPLEKQKFFLDKPDPVTPRRTALIEAAMAGHEDIVAHLLSLGANVHLADQQGWTAMASAASKGNPGIIGRLLDAGAKVNEQDAEGWTPLMDALAGNHTDAVFLLLKRGADPTLKSNDGMNALDAAIDLKRHKVIPAVEAALIRHNTAGAVENSRHIAREVDAPAPAKFRRRAA